MQLHSNFQIKKKVSFKKIVNICKKLFLSFCYQIKFYIKVFIFLCICIKFQVNESIYIRNLRYTFSIRSVQH